MILMGEKRKNPVEEFLGNYTHRSTIEGYRNTITKYFKIIKKNPETYFTKNQDYEKDIRKYWKYIIEKTGYTPKTMIVALSVVRLFLEENKIMFPKMFWKRLRNKKKLVNRAVTMDQVLKNNELKQVLSHADAMERAFFLMQSSSGLRMGEMLQIELDDIDIEQDPPRLILPGNITKNGMPRTTFISTEAKEYFEEYLKVRDGFLRTSIAKTRNGKKSMNDKRIFPYHRSVITRKWHRLLRYSKYNKKDKMTDVRIYHNHTLRKFFETRLSNAGVPPGIIHALQGHEGYLDGSYKRYTVDELAGWYNKAMPALMVFESPPDLTEVNKQMKDMETRMEKMENLLQQKEAMLQMISNRLEIEKLKNGKK